METGNKIKLLVYPVGDLTAAKALFAEFLGVKPYVDGSYYVGFRVGDQEIGLDPNAQDSTGPIGYVDVSDIKASLKSLLDAGGQLQQDVKNVGGGLLIATVKDGSGNTLGLRQEEAATQTR
jgi:predicted enzyme related to lactoylglutathione lyase